MLSFNKVETFCFPLFPLASNTSLAAWRTAFVVVARHCKLQSICTELLLLAAWRSMLWDLCKSCEANSWRFHWQKRLHRRPQGWFSPPLNCVCNSCPVSHGWWHALYYSSLFLATKSYQITFRKAKWERWTVELIQYKARTVRKRVRGQSGGLRHGSCKEGWWRQRKNPFFHWILPPRLHLLLFSSLFTLMGEWGSTPWVSAIPTRWNWRFCRVHDKGKFGSV